MKLLIAILLPCFASAVPITGVSLGFDGLQNGEQVLNYYAGGFGSDGTRPGPNDGITFTSGLTADSTMIAFGPSALVTAPSVTMSLDAPWFQLLSFYFTGNGNVSFYSGPNASGNLVYTATLTYPPFFPFAAGPGAFQSVVFAPANGSTLRLDSITLSSSPVVAEPSAVTLLLIGVFFVSFARILRGRIA